MKLKLIQEELSHALGVSFATVNRWVQWTLIQFCIPPCFLLNILFNRNVGGESKLHDLYLALKFKT